MSSLAQGRRRMAMGITLAVAGIVLLAFLPSYVGSAYWQLVAADVCVFAIFGLSYNILIGHLGLFSLAHAMYFGVAGYAIANLATGGMPLLAAAVLATAGTAVLALITAVVTLRVSGIYFAIVTLAIAQAAFTAAGRNVFGLTGGEDGRSLTGLPPSINVNVHPQNVYWLAFTALVVVTAVVWVMRRSPMGRVWDGIRENPLRAQALGVDIRAQRLVAFTLAGALAGIAGVLNSIVVQVAAPDQMALNLMVQGLLIVIIGGPGTLLGPILGAVFVRVTGPLLDQVERSSWVGDLPDIVHRALTSHAFVLGLLYIALVLFLPGGLASVGAKLRRPARE